METKRKVGRPKGTNIFVQFRCTAEERKYIIEVLNKYRLTHKRALYREQKRGV